MCFLPAKIRQIANNHKRDNSDSFLWGDAYGGEIIKGKIIIKSPKKWYFYKKHIIGYCHNQREEKNSKSYFVLNEVSEELYEFDSRKESESFLQSNGLIPKIWTRWFEYHSVNFFFIMSLFWEISIPILVLLSTGFIKLNVSSG